MRVWLVDDKSGSGGGKLELLLRQLEGRPETGLRLVGACPFQADFAASLRKVVPELLDVLVINEPVWPEGPGIQEVLSLGLALVVVATAERIERFRSPALQHAIIFASPTAGADELWLALVSALASQRRESHWQGQVTRLQQRLNDRIVIERAKGILIQHLKISEEDAYKRLRTQSRRQRRQIRDIAQSLLDAHLLLAPGNNGFGDLLLEEPEGEPDNQASQA